MTLESELATLAKSFSDDLELIFQNGTWTPRFTSVGFVSVLVNEVVRITQNAMLADLQAALSIPKNHNERVEAARNNQQVSELISRGRRVQAIKTFRTSWVDNDGRSLISLKDARDAVFEAYGLSSVDENDTRPRNDLSDVEPPF